MHCNISTILSSYLVSPLDKIVHFPRNFFNKTHIKRNKKYSPAPPCSPHSVHVAVVRHRATVSFLSDNEPHVQFFVLMKVCNPVKTGPVKAGFLCNHQKCSGSIRLTRKRSIYQSLFPFIMKTRPKAPKRFFLQYQNINDNSQSQRISFFYHEAYLKLNFSENTNLKKFRKGPASKLVIFFPVGF